MIDSKSFYASVESVELGLNPLRSILVVMSEQANTNGVWF
jgi:DNA polymerase V